LMSGRHIRMLPCDLNVLMLTKSCIGVVKNNLAFRGKKKKKMYTPSPKVQPLRGWGDQQGCWHPWLTAPLDAARPAPNRCKLCGKVSGGSGIPARASGRNPLTGHREGTHGYRDHERCEGHPGRVYRVMRRLRLLDT